MPYRKNRKDNFPIVEGAIEWANLLVEIDSKFLEKLIKRYTSKEIARFRKHLAIFLVSPNHPSLYNHSIGRGNTPYWSFSFGGDHRIIYRLAPGPIAVLVDIGNHAQLYR